MDKMIEGLVQKLKDEMHEIQDAPECLSCGGKCCKNMFLYMPCDGRPWAKKRFKDSLNFHYPMFNVKDISIKGGIIRADATCDLWSGGRCTDYANRPRFCKTFPLSAIDNFINTDSLRGSCSLLDRLLSEKDAASNS